MIGKIGGIDGKFGSLEPVNRPKKESVRGDSLEISKEARVKAKDERIAEIRKRLDKYMENGEIKQEVLDKVSNRLVVELFKG